MREIKIRSFLQQRICDQNSGRNFLSKKTASYLPEKSCVLCVHRNSLPFLEVYTTEADIVRHVPQNVYDLFDCSFISRALENDRTFIVGFKDPYRKALEFTALTANDCDDWIGTLTRELSDLQCLPPQDNVYVALPVVSNPDHHVYAEQNELLENDIEHQDDYPQRVSIDMHSRTGITQICTYETLYERFSPPCPPLPPRDKLDVLAARCCNSRDNSFEGQYMTLNRCENVEPPYDSFPNLDTLNVNSRVRNTISLENLMDSEDATTLLRENVEENVSDRVAVNNVYENVPAQEDSSISHKVQASLPSVAAYSEVKLARSVENLTGRSLSTNFISPHDATFGEVFQQENRPFSSSQVCTSTNLQPSTRESTENCRTLSIHCREVPPIRLSIKEKEVIKLKQEISSILKFKVIAEAAVRGLAFVELDSRIWVAGWNLTYNKCLSGAFHVGDELISIDDRTPNKTVEDAKRLLDSLAFTGTINITIRRLPFGNAFCLRREYEGQNLGISTKKGKNEIIFVDGNSVAAKCGLPITVSSYLNPVDQTNWFLTEINGRPLSLFANSNEAFGRLNACGRDLMIVVQPTDFIKSLRRKLKRHKKNYKDFVIGC